MPATPARPAGANLGPGDRVLCSGSLGRPGLEITARAAAAAGFQGISLYHDDYRAALAEGRTPADVRDLLDDLGLAVAELDGPMRWLPGDEVGPSSLEFVETAAALGARSVTALEIRGRRIGTDIPYAEAAAAFAAVCDQAERHGLVVHIEYFPFSGMADGRTAHEVVRRAERPNGGVMVDTWHHRRGPDAGRLDLGYPGDRVLAVQVGDVAPSPGPDVRHEAMHGRLLPGAGAGDLPRLLRSLRDQGCVAPLEVEVYSDELAALDPHDAARRCAVALDAVALAAGEGAEEGA